MTSAIGQREGVPVAQAMTDYLKHSASLGPKARAELKKKLLGEENVEEAYTVTAADKKGNTKAYQNYKAGMKKVKMANLFIKLLTT